MRYCDGYADLARGVLCGRREGHTGRCTAIAHSDKHGNRVAQEGVTRCQCGSKYWEHDHCIDCGQGVSNTHELAS